MSSPLIFVTGATGFVGSHVVDRLLRHGYRVRALTRRTSNLRWLEGKPVELALADLRDPAGLRAAMTGVSSVLHFGGRIRARTQREFFEANAEGTASLASAFLDTVRTGEPGVFLYCSSLAASGPAPVEARAPFPHVRESDPPRPVSEYGKSKLEGERRLDLLVGRVRTVIIRPPAVYGPRDEAILILLRWAERGWFPIPAQRGATFSMIHVSDLAAATVQALESPGARGLYAVDDGEAHRWEDVGAIVGEALRRRLHIVHIPIAGAWLAAAVGEGLTALGAAAPIVSFGKVREMRERSWVSRSDRAHHDFGFRPGVRAADGMKETIRWYQTQGWLRSGR